MIKKSIYPKTQRFKIKSIIQITEKIDGSNLAFFKYENELHIAQRNNIFTMTELLNNDCKNIAYKGLMDWVTEHGETILSMLQPNAVICGEWLGMGQIKYPAEEFDKKFYMFAKANIEPDFTLKNLYYDVELFKYSFIDQQLPDFIGVVPVVTFANDADVCLEFLNNLYAKYSAKKENENGRKVEGFVISNNNQITKYVRFKRGKLTEHTEKGE